MTEHQPARAETSRFAEWLARKLDERSGDLTSLAAAAGVSAAYISMLRNGKRRPSPTVVHNLAIALGAPAELDEALEAAGFLKEGASSTGAGAPARSVSARAPARARVIDRDWLIATMADFAAVCDCAIQFTPADGAPSIVARPSLVEPEPGPIAEWFQPCFSGWHAPAGLPRSAARPDGQPRVSACADGFTHVVVDVRLADRALGQLSTGALRDERFDRSVCFDRASTSGVAELQERNAVDRYVDTHSLFVDDHRLANVVTLMRLLAHAIERSAAATDRDRRAVDERTAVEEIAASLTSRLSVDEMLCRILDGVQQLIPFSYGNITEVDWPLRQIRVLVSKMPGQPAAVGSSHAREQWPVEDGITGWVASRARPRRLNDVREDPRFIRTWPPSQSELAVPLMLDGEVMGVLNIESEEPSRFTEDDERLLVMVAANVAAAVGRARLQKEQREWRMRFAGLAELHRAVLRCGDEASLLEGLARQILALDDFEMCVIRTNDHLKRRLLLGGVAHARRRLPPSEVGLKLPYQSLTGRAVQTNHTTVTPDVQAEERFHRPDLAKKLGLRGMIAVPIPSFDSREAPVGCINLYTTRSGERFTHDHQQLLEDIASFVAVAHSNLRQRLLLKAWRDVTTACRQHQDDAAGQALALDEVCRLVRDQVAARCVSLFGLRDGVLRLKGTTGIHGVDTAEDREMVTIPEGTGKTGWVARHGTSICLADRTDDTELEFYPDVDESHRWVERERPPAPEESGGTAKEAERRIEATKKRPFLAVPILSTSRTVIGVVRAVGTTRELAFTSLDLEILETCALTIGDLLKRRLLE